MYRNALARRTVILEREIEDPAGLPRDRLSSMDASPTTDFRPPMPKRRFIVLVALLVPAISRAEVSPDAAGIAFFESRIRPVLIEQCYKCHSAEAKANGKLKAELYLDSREATLKGGENGPALVPGKPAESLLIKAIRYGDEDLQMPPKNRLSPAVVADFEHWIAMGAPDPRTGGAAVKKGIDIAAGRKFWSFQPLQAVNVPVPQRQDWAKTAVDAFILAELEARHLAPNPAASRQKLIRRAYLDLIGLPPSPAEVDAFEQDPSPSAYATVIARLLASPRYGERWGRHWLDVARFAESDGFEQDYDRPAAYQFRDFVIRALNADMPFNQFVQWQIAGDELAPDNWQALAATGFLTAGVFPTQITEKEFEVLRESYPKIPFYHSANQYVKIPAGWLIEQCGWKGKRVGRIGVHEHQALVIVNYGGGSGEEIFQLATMIRTSVNEKFNVLLESEVNVI